MKPIEIAQQAALIVIRNGGSTTAAARSFHKILTGYRVKEISAIWRLDFVAARSLADGESSSVVEPVGPIGVNLVRAVAVAALSERVAQGKVIGEAVGDELARIKDLPTPYGRWVVVGAAACLSAAFSQIPGGDSGAAALAFVAAGLGQFLRFQLQAMKVAVAPVTFICALLSASIASNGLRQEFSQTAPPALIASVIYLAPGLPLINGFVDMASHKYLLVGIERMATALFLFLVIAIAIALTYTAIV